MEAHTRQLPNSWVAARIGDLCDLKNGRAFKPVDWTSTGLPIVRIQNLNNPDAAFNYFDGDVRDRFLIEHGNLLFAWSGTPGTSFGAHIWSGGRAVLNQHIFRVDFNQDLLNKKYFMYAINSKLEELIGKAHGGVGLRHVTKGKFEDTLIPLPPLAEQQRIIAKLEELFSELDQGAGSLESAQRKCETYQHIITENAFSHATEFRLLPELLAQPMSNGYSGKPVQRVTPWKVLSLSATTSGTFLAEHFKYLDEPGLEIRDIWCAPGDILVQRGNTAEYVGVPAIYTGAAQEFIFPDLMIRLRADRAVITPAYLYYALSTPKIRNEMRKKAKGSAGTMPKISQKILAEVRVPYFDPSDQLRITQYIDAATSNIRAIDKTISEETERSRALKHSILRRAFSGQLVGQVPTDEPASALLERIRAEQEETGDGRRKNNNGKEAA